MAEFGMILRMLVPFPLQKAKKPCSEATPMKKFNILEPKEGLSY